MNAKVKTLELLIKSAKELGLPEDDLNNATDLLRSHEYGLCFHTIITQMYEYDICINMELYELIRRIGNRMNIPIEDYAFMKNQISEADAKISKSVKDIISQILENLKEMER